MSSRLTAEARRIGLARVGLAWACGILGIVSSTASPTPVLAQTPPPPSPGALSASTTSLSAPQEGALFLLLPTGAQAVGLGRAMTALPSQESAFWNPAGLAELEGSRFVVSRGEHLAGEAVAFSLLLQNASLGTFGLSYQLLDVGDQDRTDEQGNVIGEVSFRDHLATVSFATRVIERISAGVNLKLVRRRIACRGACLDDGVTATTFAVDAGIQAQPVSAIPLRLGVMLAHAGPHLQVVNAEQADPLPTRLRISWAYDVAGYFLSRPDLGLWITAEMEDRWRSPGSPSVYVGGEFTAGRDDAFYARAGYEAGESSQNQGAAMGVGFRYDDFDVSLAKSLSRSALTGESQPVHVTLGIVFD